MEMYAHQCPFCGDGDFSAIGMCRHLAHQCPAYDRACRLTSDDDERRESQTDTP